MSLLRQTLVFAFYFVSVLFKRALRGPRVPGWTRRFEMFVAHLRYEARRQYTMAPSRVRDEMLSAPIPRSLSGKVQREWREMVGRRVEVLTPQGWEEGDMSLLYLHGGGYVICSPGTHRDLTARLSAAAKAKVYVLDYRLAPEHPYPAAIDDVVALWQSFDLDRGPYAIAGDSAGGGLAIALMLRLRALGAAMPDSAVLLSPWVDLTFSSSSLDTSPDDYLQRPMLERFKEHYLQGQSAALPEVSPLFADLDGLPRTLLMSGEREVFIGENRAFADRAKEAGCDLRFVVGEGMIHVWPAFAAILPEGRVAIQDIALFLSESGT